jgi:hypothetical protein
VKLHPGPADQKPPHGWHHLLENPVPAPLSPRTSHMPGVLTYCNLLPRCR